MIQNYEQLRLVFKGFRLRLTMWHTAVVAKLFWLGANILCVNRPRANDVLYDFSILITCLLQLAVPQNYAPFSDSQLRQNRYEQVAIASTKMQINHSGAKYKPLD